MVENMVFLDSEHIGMGGMLLPQKCTICFELGKQVQVGGKSSQFPPEEYPCTLRNFFNFAQSKVPKGASKLY